MDKTGTIKDKSGKIRDKYLAIPCFVHACPCFVPASFCVLPVLVPFLFVLGPVLSLFMMGIIGQSQSVTSKDKSDIQKASDQVIFFIKKKFTHILVWGWGILL